MAVAGNKQGRGLGSRMLQFLEGEARKRSIRRIILDARDTAVDFYLKNGYTIEGDSYILFNVIPHFRMIKDLE
jgi:GNAT superfamily N-acetyltransferase